MAQIYLVDSLESELSNYEKGEIKYLDLLNQIGKEYSESDPDTALVIATNSLNIARETNQDSLFGQAYIVISMAYSYRAQYDSSLSYSFKALDVGTIYQDTSTIIDAYNNLGIDFMYREEYTTVLDYFNKSRIIAKQFNDSLTWAHSINNLGMIYGYQEDYETELKYYNQASPMFKAIGEEEGYANTLLNTGTVYTYMGDFQTAALYYDSALILYKEIDYVSAIGQTYINFAENYFKSGNIEQALEAANLALKIAEDQEFNQDKIYIYELFVKIHYEEGNIAEAFAYQKKYYSLKEEVFNKEKSKQIYALQSKYEFSSKQAQINKLTFQNELRTADLQKARWQISFLVTGFIFVLGLVFLFFWLKAKRQKVKNLEMTLKFEALQKRYMELFQGPVPFDIGLEINPLNQKLVNPLTDREFEILKLSMTGKTKQEIGEELFISINTVKFHVSNIYNKLGVNNKREALEYVAKAT